MWWDFGGIVTWFIISSGYFALRNAVTLKICFYKWGVNIWRDSPKRFLLPIFSQMDSSQASYFIFKDFSKFGFEFEEIFAIFDWLSAIIYGRELILPVLFNTKSCDSPPNFSGESRLPALFIAGSNCWQPGVILKNFGGLILPIKEQWSKKCTMPVEHCSLRNFISMLFGLIKAQFLTPRCQWILWYLRYK
jgi:hypothetical protein